MSLIRAHLIIENPPDGMVKEFRQLVTTGLVNLVDNWHKEIAPHHFTEQAKAKYNYAARTVKYLQYKAKKKPMAGPLEFSGLSKGLLLRKITIRGNSKRAVGKMQAPRYFWMTPKNQPNKPEELLEVTQKEAMAMARRLNERVTGQLTKVKNTKIYR